MLSLFMAHWVEYTIQNLFHALLSDQMWWHCQTSCKAFPRLLLVKVHPNLMWTERKCGIVQLGVFVAPHSIQQIDCLFTLQTVQEPWKVLLMRVDHETSFWHCLQRLYREALFSKVHLRNGFWAWMLVVRIINTFRHILYRVHFWFIASVDEPMRSPRRVYVTPLSLRDNSMLWSIILIWRGPSSFEGTRGKKNWISSISNNSDVGCSGWGII